MLKADTDQQGVGQDIREDTLHQGARNEVPLSSIFPNKA